MNSTPPVNATEPPMPVRRDLRFDLPAERIVDWNGNGRHLAFTV